MFSCLSFFYVDLFYLELGCYCFCFFSVLFSFNKFNRVYMGGVNVLKIVWFWLFLPVFAGCYLFGSLVQQEGIQLSLCLFNHPSIHPSFCNNVFQDQLITFFRFFARSFLEHIKNKKWVKIVVFIFNSFVPNAPMHPFSMPPPPSENIRKL